LERQEGMGCREAEPILERGTLCRENPTGVSGMKQGHQVWGGGNRQEVEKAWRRNGAGEVIPRKVDFSYCRRQRGRNPRRGSRFIKWTAARFREDTPEGAQTQERVKDERNFVRDGTVSKTSGAAAKAGRPERKGRTNRTLGPCISAL